MKSLEFATCAIALSIVTVALGCEDRGAIESLKDETSKLSREIDDRNRQLTDLADELDTCVGDLAKAKNQAVVIQRTDPALEAPELAGEENMAGLMKYKESLNAVLEKQQTKIAELKDESTGCSEDLQAAEEKQQQAAKRAADTRKDAKQPGNEESEWEQEREEEDKATKGVMKRF